ncbi:hypothetical protein phiK7A1_010c [Pseudomonas phage phiK7A1]|uniref:Uncharacterized protein n=1 Tax=Pseudomonas phage phiK7A1 TaxID=2759194 RepID=A0A7H0XFL0_9CAUD|nr:hypothetical protein phiK7A1_010c [Pseudomonas phage phiK7A1]
MVKVVEQEQQAALTVLRPIVSIVAAIVTLDDQIQVFYSESIPVICSAQADARCAELDAAFGNTTSYVNKYTVTYEGPEGYGNVFVYTKKQFVTQIEPKYPPVVWPPIEE